MNKSYASRIKKEANHYRNIMKYLNNGRYVGTDEGKRIYGALMAFSPQTSFESMELIINLAHAAFLRDTGIADNVSQLGCYTPSASTLQQLIHECATDSMYEACEEILSDGCKIFLTADKGAMKGSHTHFVKIISWYSTKSKRIKTFCLDTDDSDGSSSDCANAIRHALIKIFGRDNVDFILQGQMTDSGGGGTGLSFHRNLQNQGITTNNANYLVGYCTLHCIQ